MKHLVTSMSTLLLLALLAPSACVVEDDIAATRGAILLGADSEQSSLRWNRIYWNRIYWNRIYWNGLSPGQQLWHEIRSDTLIAGPLSEAADDSRFTEALTDSAVRDLFGYVVECALPGGTAVSYVDDDGATWTFPGLHGLTPEWETTQGCDVTCQRTVSACIYARVNYFGQRNVLSWRTGSGIRSTPSTPGMEDPSADEDASFHLDEGAVWGNMFLENPEMWVCRGSDTVVGLSLPGVDLGIYNGQVPMGAIRMCAGDQDCLEEVYAGPCYAHPDAVCQSKHGQNDAYDQCAAPGGSVYTEVLTIHRADFGFHADFVPGAGLDPVLSSCASKAAAYAPTSDCANDWDTGCVDYALGAGWSLALEELGCNNGLLPGTGHAVSQVGTPLDRHTSTCTAYVCAIDGSCCDDLLNGWDADCVAMAAEICQ